MIVIDAVLSHDSRVQSHAVWVFTVAKDANEIFLLHLNNILINT